ncbi:hypothetical protein JOF29_000493 [Kribbella aluminosa]|uniref:HNH nuclease domain-containing protein n=1 Tax=Kribbella aluminosa TaxID=416017 RepID=A0ABS4UCV8_9ACTN|nr:HNH endonuclease signature motif containing protein [Kribbella aluminosa]MBP2349410.1 hypothetical protein [Kribbella aluminosa]
MSRVVGMEILGERPVWSMSGSEALSALDAVVAEDARIQTLKWQLQARVDTSGHAKELGAGDTARLMATRYRQDLKEVRRELRLANRLGVYPATSAALPDPSTPFANPAHAATPDTDDDAAWDERDDQRRDELGDDLGDDLGDRSTGADEASDSVDEPASESSEQPADERGGAAAGGWRVSPAQAAAIISVLDQVPNTVPAENLAVAEQELIGLAATHTPSELRRAGRAIRERLDPDGPEPDENAAYTRESLTLKNADRGVTFAGYLANENAELLRTLIHAYARPHKTDDGELDPRPLSKRQADALTTILNTPAPSITTPPSTTTRPGTGSSGTMPARAGAGVGGTRPSGYGDLLPFPPNRTTSRAEPDAPAPSSGSGGVPTSSPSRATGTGTGSTAEAGGRGGTKPGGVGDASTRVPADRHTSTDLDPGLNTGTHASVNAGTDTGVDTGTDASTQASVDAGVDSGVGGRGSAGREVVSGHGPKAHISVTIDFNDLAAATATATGALIFGDNLSAATVRRLACDAEVLPIVLGSKSQPLDVGTSQRLVTRHMRRALNARDKGCVICHAPPIQTEAHHIIHWADGGPTAVTNLALLCKRHHQDLHAGHWQIRILNGIVQVTRPTWSNPSRIPPGKYHPPTANIVHQPPSRSNPWGDDDTPPPPTSPKPPTSADIWGADDLPALSPHAPPIIANPPWDDDPPTPRAATPPPMPADPWGDDDVPSSPARAARPIAVDPWGDATPIPVAPRADDRAPAPADPGRDDDAPCLTTACLDHRRSGSVG